MTTRVVLVVLAALALRGAGAPAQSARPGGGPLTAFRSDRELSSYLRARAAERARYLEAERARYLQQMAAQQAQLQAAKSCKGSVRVARAGTGPAGTVPSGAVVTGRVAAGAQDALAGAQVLVAGLGVGALTGADGRYRLVVPADSLTTRRDLTLSARRIGYATLSRVVRLGAGDSVEVGFTLCAASAQLQAVVVSRMAAAKAEAPAAALSDSYAAESVTNTQHAGVDEGGIVKLHGEHLVMLRRGRLFTVAVGGDELRPISAVDAFAPGIDPSGTWYDEMLIAGDKVIVIGFSYQRGGTEIGVIRIDRAGQLRYEATYHLRSNDYYSSRNYASRLIGSKLVFYTPLYLPYGMEDPTSALPALRRWYEGVGEGAWERIASARRVYRPAREPSAGDNLALHSVTVCDLAAAELTCEATAVIGPPGRVFYVSPSAVYVWMSDWARRDGAREAPAMLYRMPLDGSAPSAVGVWGTPVDQFSFLESGDGYLNVLVRSEAQGDAMWGPEVAAGDAALLRTPVAEFGDGSDAVLPWRYRALPSAAGYAFQNRFVGDHLLYGVGNGWGRPQESGATLHVVPWRGGAITDIALPHGVDRIEAMGADAVVVGTDGRDLHFTGIRLARRPAVAQRFTLPNASQGELRSHGFFYKPEDAGSGVLGLPVSTPGRPGYRHLFESSASILFLRNDGRAFRELGELAANDEGATDDACRASCVDWYGNARPLFVRGRVFALLGYELVEGSIRDGRIHEVRRISYAPRAVAAVGR